MKRITGIIIASLIVMTAFAGMSAYAAPVQGRGPIRIDSDAGFNVTNGVTAGDGTAGNPWIIDNWVIDGTGAGCCIYVGNTTDYFTIRNCTLKNADGMNNTDQYYGNAGVYLNHLSHGTATNNTILSNDGYGVCLESSGSCSIYANDIIGNNGGMVQAWDNNGGNEWDNGYPDGGNFWGDMTSPDNKHGVNQDMQGSDGIVDRPYHVDIGSYVDEYPLTAPVGTLDQTTIEIVSHNDGDYVSGTEEISVKSYGDRPSGMMFYVDGVESTYVPGSLLVYNFLFNSSGFAEDSSVQITAEAIYYDAAPVSASVSLNINNAVATGNFIDVTVMDSPYHPGEDVGFLITIQNAPPAFDRLNSRIGYEVSPGQYNYFNRNNNPVATTYTDNVFLQRDMTNGTHNLTVWAWGLDDNELVWEATATATFEVTDGNLFETLAGMNSTFLAELDNVNSSLAANIDGLMTGITNDIAGMNSTVGAELQSLLDEVDTNDAALTAWLDKVLDFIDQNTTDTNQNVPKLDTILANLTALSQAMDDAEGELDASIAANAPVEATDHTGLLMAILALAVISMLFSLLAFLAASKLGRNSGNPENTMASEPEPEPIQEPEPQSMDTGEQQPEPEITEIGDE